MSHAVEQHAKQIGMNFAAIKHSAILEKFRTIAQFLSRMGTVDIDMVRQRAEDMGVEYVSGNWLGSVFTAKEWVWTGEVKASTHPGSHGRMIKVWRRR